MKPLHKSLISNLMKPLQTISWMHYQLSRNRREDVFLVTLTGAGTHWLRMLLAKSIDEAYGLNETIDTIRPFHLVPPYRNKVHQFKYNDRPDIPRIQHSHSPYSLFFRKTRVILLVRDLRDAMASHYKMMRTHKGYQETFSDFLKGKGLSGQRQHTLETRIKFLNSWSDNQASLGDFLLVRFEDLKADTPGQLDRVLAFSGIKPMEKEGRKKVIEFASAQNMRKIEAMNPLPQYRGETKKVGKGSTGGYKAVFSPEDQQYLYSVVSDRLHENFGYDYQPETK